MQAPQQRSMSGQALHGKATFRSQRRCRGCVIDAAKVRNKVVVCDRGVNNRVDKSAAVKAAGGVGMVLVNVETGSINADLHAVPSVHLDAPFRDTLLSFCARPGSKAAISKGVKIRDLAAPSMASFSSRGPWYGDILKPVRCACRGCS
jgi:hypothetical protein